MLTERQACMDKSSGRDTGSGTDGSKARHRNRDHPATYWGERAGVLREIRQVGRRR